MAQLLSSGQLKTAKLKRDLLFKLVGLSRKENDVVDLEAGLLCQLLKRFLLARSEF